MAKRMADERKKNSINPEAMKKWVGQFDNLDREALSLHGKYMSDRKEIIAERKQLFKNAKAEGVPTKELKTLLEERDLRKKIKELHDELDIDQRSIFQQMVDAMGGERGLGGLPLAEAAIKAAGAEPDNDNSGDDGDQDAGDKDAAAAAENAKRVLEGIKPLESEDEKRARKSTLQRERRARQRGGDGAGSEDTIQ